MFSLAPGAGTSPATRGDDEIEAVLFDIGGVLADFAGLRAMHALVGDGASEVEVADRWLLSPWVRSFEAGRCSEAEFASGVVSEWGFPVTASEFLDLFRGWLGDPLHGAEEMVCEAKAHAAVGCLSNTNALHWREVISRWPLMPLLDHRFLSFELGMVKPEPQIFDAAAAELGVAPERVLFLDDNALNVAGARDAGLRAEQTRGVQEARAVLRRYALLG